jgi:hypothetical protein
MTQRPGPPALPTETLDVLAAANPDLQRLLAERAQLEARMQAIVAGSPGGFTPRDSARFPVEPLNERRARDARGGDARDDRRTSAIRNILDARRREAADEIGQWEETRDRQRADAIDEAQTRRHAFEQQAEALDARIESARAGLLAERWGPPAAGSEDWHALREQAAAAALAEARARTTETAEREAALQRRVARDRAARPADWSEARDRARAQALELARRQAVEAATAEAALDTRFARAREERLRANRAAQDPERPPAWVPPSDRRDSAPLPAEPPRPLPPTAAERSLDDRIERARAAARARREKVPVQREAPAERSLDDRIARARAAARTRREETPVPTQAPAERPAPHAGGRIAADQRFADRHATDALPALPTAPVRPFPERPAPPRPAAQRPVADPAPDFEARREAMRARSLAAHPPVRTAARLTPARAAPRPRAAPVRTESFEARCDRLRTDAFEARRDRLRAERAEQHRAEALPQPGTPAPAPADRNPLLSWQEGRERLARVGRGTRAREFDMGAGSVDELTSLRDRERELWPEKKRQQAREQPKPKPKMAADRLTDLDKRREQALEKLKSRRRGEDRDARRREHSPEGLASSLDDRFGSTGG